MRQWWWMMPGLALLAGCQTTPTVLPTAEPQPAAECRWEADGLEPREWVRRALNALEADGFVVRDTEPAVGLVSADRTRTIPGYGDRSDTWQRTGFFGGVGIGAGRGVSTGMMIGFGGAGGSIAQDATQLERVSVIADPGGVRVSRDIQVIDWRGELRETRSGSDAPFCRSLRQAMTAVPAGESL